MKDQGLKTGRSRGVALKSCAADAIIPVDETKNGTIVGDNGIARKTRRRLCAKVNVSDSLIQGGVSTRTMPKRGRGRPIVATLTDSQQRLLEAIEEHIAREGHPPTLRELADQFEQGVASVYKTVLRLERNGYVSRTAGKSRSLSVLRSAHEEPLRGLISIPLLGTVAAGTPLFAPENRLGDLLIDAATVRAGQFFALKVTGDSMIGAGIHSGDILIVRQQVMAEHRDIVVALLNDEATVKRLHYRRGETSLVPENSEFDPIPVGPNDSLRIVGKVVAVKRSGSLASSAADS